MTEALIVAAAKKISVKLTEQLAKDGKSVISNVKDEAVQVFGKDIQNYLYNNITKYSKVKTILHSGTPVFFYNFYFPLEVYKKPDLVKSRDSKKDKSISTEHIHNIFNSSNMITILGDAGSGKSTLVKHLFFNSILENFKIPIFIELRYLNEFDGDIEKYILNKILENRIAQNILILERLLKNGNFVFFLDGYDEIKASIRNKTVDKINSFVDRYNSNYFILTARPFTNIESLPLFHNYCMKKLNEEEIEKFIDKQLHNNDNQQEWAKKIKKSVKSSDNSYIKSFLANPLLLSLYILTFQNYPSIPTKKYIFYRRVIETLFSEHDSRSKVGFVRERRTEFSQDTIEKILQKFCFISFFENKYDFDKEYIQTKLSYIKERMQANEFDIDDLISDLKEAIPLWVEDNGITSFAHRSLQEFFAASYIKELDFGNKKEIYSRMRDKYKFDLKNLLSLCEELDEKSYLAEYFLPICNKVYEDVFTNKKESDGFNFFRYTVDNYSMTLDEFDKIKSQSMRVNNIMRKFQYISSSISEEFTDLLFTVFDVFRGYYNSSKESFAFENTNIASTERRKTIEYNFKNKDPKSILPKGFIKFLNLYEPYTTKVKNFKQNLKKSIDEKSKYIEKLSETDLDIINMV